MTQVEIIFIKENQYLFACFMEGNDIILFIELGFRAV